MKGRKQDTTLITRPHIPLVAFLALLLLLTIPFSFATSVVPGWHTTIFPPYFIWTLALLLVLLFIAIGYWLLSKRVDKTNWTLFIIHLLLTIPTVVFIRFPFLFLDIQGTSQEELIRSSSFRLKLIPWSYGVFVAGQILFLIYFIRTIRTKPLKK